MELIQHLEELIDEEIHDVKKYAKMAAEVKAEHPGLAQVLYALSTQEDAHQAALHAEVVKIIDNYRKSHGEPPAPMKFVYDYLHKQHIEKLAEARRLQEIYKSA